MTRPHLRVTFEPAGRATVEGPCGITYRGRYDERAGIWPPGTRRTHTVGVHGGRLAVVQQGIDTMSLGHLDHEGVWRGDGRGRGDRNGPGWWWRGINIHDDRGPVVGCVALSSADMLDLLGEIETWRQGELARGRQVQTHRKLGAPILSVEVIHALR